MRVIKNAVITGPTGAIGTALCRELISHDIEVYAVCRPGSSRIAALPVDSKIHCVECDLNELSELAHKITVKIDVFFHFAWTNTIGPGRNDISAQINNIKYTIEAVRVAQRLGCQVFIGAGSQAEYGRCDEPLKPKTPCFPENGYGIAKLCAGQMSRLECAKLGIDHIWTRILSVYGPNDGPNTLISSLIQQLYAGEKPKLTAGEQKWDYLYSMDVARAFRLLAIQGKSGMVYPVGSGNAKPLKEYIISLRDHINPNAKLGFGEIPYNPLQVMHLEADISNLIEDTGFIPKYSFEEGIRETLEWVRKNI